MTRGDWMDSIWSKEWPRVPNTGKRLPASAEVVIIGGGITGLLCAYLLKEADISAIVLEADHICSGQTKNTTAKITSQHGLLYKKLSGVFGEDVAMEYGKMNERAIDEFERIIMQEKIDCSFKWLSSYLYTNTELGAALLKQEYEIAKKAGILASLVSEPSLPFSVHLALKYDRQAQFHPLKFLKGISKELELYEKTNVIQIKRNLVMTDRGDVDANKIVITTHFPFINIPGFYFARMHQERSYVLAVDINTKNDPMKKEINLLADGMYYGIDADGLSLRYADGCILVGGKSERTGLMHQTDPYETLRKEAKRIWPECREIASWAAQDCMTLDGLPYIGVFSKLRSNWYVATGFEKWGMTNAMIAAMAIRDYLTDRDTKMWRYISPQRSMPAEAYKTLAKEALFTAKQVLRLKKPRCPHLGCRLVWNPYEKSWDCPCHGSRFSEDGRLIDNPAQKHLNR